MYRNGGGHGDTASEALNDGVSGDKSGMVGERETLLHTLIVPLQC